MMQTASWSARGGCMRQGCSGLARVEDRDGDATLSYVPGRARIDRCTRRGWDVAAARGLLTLRQGSRGRAGRVQASAGADAFCVGPSRRACRSRASLHCPSAGVHYSDRERAQPASERSTWASGRGWWVAHARARQCRAQWVLEHARYRNGGTTAARLRSPTAYPAIAGNRFFDAGVIGGITYAHLQRTCVVEQTIGRITARSC